MPINQFTVKAVPASEQERTSFLEFVRLRGEYLYDKIFITRFAHNIEGIEIRYEYERNTTRMRDLPPTIISAKDWAVSRKISDTPATAEAKRDAMAATPVVLRLFAEGARNYNDANVVAEESFAADAAFLADIGPTP